MKNLAVRGGRRRAGNFALRILSPAPAPGKFLRGQGASPGQLHENRLLGPGSGVIDRRQGLL